MTTPGTAAWHRPLHHTRAGELDPDTTQTKGMQRFEALSARYGGTTKLWLGENHVGPRMNSGDHHHGEAETGIYVVSGHPVFVFLEDGRERRIETGPGDYVFVPPYVPHREENPNDEPAVVVLARSTQEGIVVNLPSLATTRPEGSPSLGAIARGAILPDGAGQATTRPEGSPSLGAIARGAILPGGAGQPTTRPEGSPSPILPDGAGQ